MKFMTYHFHICSRGFGINAAGYVGVVEEIKDLSPGWRKYVVAGCVRFKKTQGLLVNPTQSNIGSQIIFMQHKTRGLQTHQL